MNERELLKAQKRFKKRMRQNQKSVDRTRRNMDRSIPPEVMLAMAASGAAGAVIMTAILAALQGDARIKANATMMPNNKKEEGGEG